MDIQSMMNFLVIFLLSCLLTAHGTHIGHLFKTSRDKALFWSGSWQNATVFHVAQRHARQQGLVTLEILIEHHAIQMPVYDRSNSESLRQWQLVSKAMAQEAHGRVQVILGDQVNPHGVFNTVELPALLTNTKVTVIHYLNVLDISVVPTQGILNEMTHNESL